MQNRPQTGLKWRFQDQNRANSGLKEELHYGQVVGDSRPPEPPDPPIFGISH